MNNLNNFIQSWFLLTSFQVLMLGSIAYIAYQSYKKTQNKNYKISDGRLMVYTHFGLAVLITWLFGLLDFNVTKYVLNPLIDLSNILLHEIMPACNTTFDCYYIWLDYAGLPFVFGLSYIVTTIIYFFDKKIVRKINKNSSIYKIYFYLFSLMFIGISIFLFSMMMK